MYNCNTDSLGLILGVEVFFSEGHCSGALCNIIFVYLFMPANNIESTSPTTTHFKIFIILSSCLLSHVLITYSFSS